jgi:hypothetical protein
MTCRIIVASVTGVSCVDRKRTGSAYAEQNGPVDHEEESYHGVVLPGSLSYGLLTWRRSME